MIKITYNDQEIADAAYLSVETLDYLAIDLENLAVNQKDGTMAQNLLLAVRDELVELCNNK